MLGNPITSLIPQEHFRTSEKGLILFEQKEDSHIIGKTSEGIGVLLNIFTL